MATLPHDMKEDVRNHIKSITRIYSHYYRSDSMKEYIEGGKTIADLHCDYIKPVSYTHLDVYKRQA